MTDFPSVHPHLHDQPSEADLEQAAGENPALAVFQQGIRDRHMLRVAYQPVAGPEMDLLVEPYYVRLNRGEHIVVWAWEVENGYVTDLLLSHVREASDTGDTYAPHPPLAHADDVP